MQKNLNYVDSHCHFDFDAFTSDRTQIWERCRQQGLKSMLVPGVEPKQWGRAAKLCEQNRGFYFSLGFHPWFLESEFASEKCALEQIRHSSYLQHPSCIAIGECGLDKAILSNVQQHGLATSQAEDQTVAMIELRWQQQLKAMHVHLELAREYGLPLILHVVAAHADTLALLKSAKLKAGGVVHAFSGSFEIAREYWDLGFRLGVGGVITYERAKKTRQAIKKMPLEALLLETDAPSMPLFGHQGSRNSPEYIPLIAKQLAQLKDIDQQTIAKQTTDNFFDLFKLAKR